MTTRPHLVALDVDGTTINHAGEMSAAVLDAVQAVAAAGHHVTIATGRAILATLPILSKLGITTGYAVCSNGAVTLRLDPGARDGYEVIDAVTFDPRPALELLRAEWPDAVVAVEELGVGFTAWLNINPEGVSKGSALELVRRHLGVEPARTVAVGDQRNDLEMLRWAARGVAMGNAPDEVKAAADETTLDVDDDGLVPVLQSLL
jgi:hydroxymethylpyrimidine pyrophosphatase-like HAD family hydrolase